jgi:chemotaxis protein methyltransferase CheR
VVFCRNVLIYFDQQTKAEVLERLARVIVSDGYLVLGAAETVIGLSSSLRPIPEKRALYGPNPAQTRAAGGAPRIAAVSGPR